MGVLYIFTGGLFGIGAFVDLIVILCSPVPIITFNFLGKAAYYAKHP